MMLWHACGLQMICVVVIVIVVAVVELVITDIRMSVFRTFPDKNQCVLVAECTTHAQTMGPTTFISTLPNSSDGVLMLERTPCRSSFK